MTDYSRATYSRTEFEKQLLEDGATEKLAAFRTSADRLKGDSVALAVFTFNSSCAYNDLPNNDGSGNWSEYVRTGVWNGKKIF
jgi:hypothetical protein